jgi:uncharacterized coiled-coil protein SlyX
VGNPLAAPSPRLLDFPKTIELEQRLARLELTVAELRLSAATDATTIKDLRETVAILHKRMVSLQAHLDHAFARIVPY